MYSNGHWDISHGISHGLFIINNINQVKFSILIFLSLLPEYMLEKVCIFGHFSSFVHNLPRSEYNYVPKNRYI